MAKASIDRPWFCVTEAAAYVGVSPDLVRQAIYTGALNAYEKPVTRKRTGSKHNIHCRIHAADLDAWVRSWPKVGTHET